MLQRVRRLSRELHSCWRGLLPQPEVEQEVDRLFRHGPFPSGADGQLRRAVVDFYVRGLGLPAPLVEEVDSLTRAAQCFRSGARIPARSALLLATLQAAGGPMGTTSQRWRQQLGAVWNLTCATTAHVELALWGHTLGAVSACAPRWVYRSRLGCGGLLEQLAGRIVEAGGWCCWLQADRVLVLRAPHEILVDREGRLHAEGRPALRWRDGRGHWAHHGRLQPLDFDPSAVHYEQLERMSLWEREHCIEVMGYPWLFGLATPRLVDFDLEASGYPRRLLELPFPGESVMVVVLVCPSTGKSTFLRVPPEMRTCAQAVAWSFGFDEPERYQPWQET